MTSTFGRVHRVRIVDRNESLDGLACVLTTTTETLGLADFAFRSPREVSDGCGVASDLTRGLALLDVVCGHVASENDMCCRRVAG